MADSVTLTELETALDALIMEDICPRLEPADITVQGLAKRADCSPELAKEMLEKWTNENKIEYLGLRREARGHKVQAWRIRIVEQ